MSESRAIYVVSADSAGPSEASLLPFDDPGYSPPTWEDVRAVVRSFNLTGSQVADLVGVSSRGVRKWMSPPDTANHAPMPYAAWRLLLIAAQLAQPPEL